MTSQPSKASARSVLDKFQALESQWRQYERKIATHSAEQSESLKKTALLQKQSASNVAAPLQVRGGGSLVQSPSQSCHGSPPRQQLVPAEVAGASQRHPAALPSSHQANGEELAVQKASNLFLQQIEDSRRKYAFEVEEAKAEASKWAEKRDAYARDSQQAAEHAAEMQAASHTASQKLERLQADVGHAKTRLVALERAHEAGIQSQEHEREAASQAFDQERMRQQQVLQAEHKAALQIMQTERATIAESLRNATQQLHEAESKNKHLLELESDLQRREDILSAR